MNKAKLIRELKIKNPSWTTNNIADEVGVDRGYVSHILWRSREPNKKKDDYIKDFEEQLSINESLKKEIEKLENEIRTLKIVNKFLREN